ncbi:unnamed protein product, partial [Symbiodinium sp. CCMP2456]
MARRPALQLATRSCRCSSRTSAVSWRPRMRASPASATAIRSRSERPSTATGCSLSRLVTSCASSKSTS